MSEVHEIGILGCGDFLRWEHQTIKSSRRVRVRSLYDPATERARKYAGFFAAGDDDGDDVVVADSAEAVLEDERIDVVLLFTPPFTRHELVLKAAEAGKHIITVKPLAPGLEQATDMVRAVRDRVTAAVLYRRSGDAQIEMLKRILKGGEIGNLALYRQDWIHHYPTWNRWAVEPDKNGGPFMDAMVHNLNTARYLSGSDVVACAFFSDNHAQELPCNDTEFLKADFGDGGAAHLFITWAADLEIYDPTKNDREHIDLFYMATDRRWYVTVEDGRVKARRDGEVRTWQVEPRTQSVYDEFVQCVQEGRPVPWDMEDAWKDIAIMETAAANPGRTVPVDLARNGG